MISNELMIPIQAAIKAGESIMEIYSAFSEADVTYKEDRSPLTKADLEANRIICEHLERTDYPIISEENIEIDYAIRKNWDYCWIVDPLDGTKEFIKRNGEFTVNIALCKEGIPILGVIYAPAIDSLYYADVMAKQAFKSLPGAAMKSERLGDSGDQIFPAQPDPARIRVAVSRSHLNTETIRFLEGLKKEFKKLEYATTGSALKFCLVAEGKADIYPRFAPTMEWDTAAGQALCTAVGLKVIDQQTQKPIVYNRENLMNAHFIVR